MIFLYSVRIPITFFVDSTLRSGFLSWWY